MHQPHMSCQVILESGCVPLWSVALISLHVACLFAYLLLLMIPESCRVLGALRVRLAKLVLGRMVAGNADAFAYGRVIEARATRSDICM